MKQVAIVIMDKSVGNESVGEMWKETKVFNLEDPISKYLNGLTSQIMSTQKEIL
jgi:hypothetical protein